MFSDDESVKTPLAVIEQLETPPPSNKSLARSLSKARSIGSFTFDVSYDVSYEGEVANVIVDYGVPLDIQRIASKYVSKFEYKSADVGAVGCNYTMKLTVKD